MKKRSKIAFDFVLEQLERLRPVARPMFGCHAIYIGEKLVLITRDRPQSPEDNGVWVATRREYHESLSREISSLRSIGVLGKGKTHWQVIPSSSESFEEDVNKACELILRHDERIGSIGKSRTEAKIRKAAKKPE
jgi:hypothetical protein